MAIIVLPPGSTQIDLQNAINGAGIGDIIEISNNITFTTSIVISVSHNIMIISNGGPFILTQTTSPQRHFIVNGMLTLENIILSGNSPIQTTNHGGILVNSDGILNMNGGAVVRNNRIGASSGGGVFLGDNAIFNMSGGTIENNISAGAATAVGGGVYVSNGAVFNMSGGTIAQNKAQGAGGGVYVDDGGIFNMNNAAVINANHSSTSGGGVFTAGTFNMSNGLIAENAAGASAAAGNGGGVAIGGSGSFTQTGGTIEHNGAGFRGGGVAVMTAMARFDFVRGEIRQNGQSRTVTTHAGTTVTLNVTGSGGGIGITGATPGMTTPGGTLVLGWAYDNTAIPLITGNNAWSGGGIAATGVLLTVHNAVVHGNTATAAAGRGGGIWLGYSSINNVRSPRSAVTIYNITVTGNTAPGATSQGGGMYTRWADITMYNGRFGGGAPGEGNIASGAGGGMSIWSTEFIMYGGAVSGNTVTNTSPTHNAAGIGGGVHVGQLAFFTKNGGIIGGYTPEEANRAHSGAGMWIAGDWWATITLNEGALIHGNIASNRAGGVGGWFGTTLIMNGGRISGNTAVNGGGVYLFTDIAPSDPARIPRFYMNGGIIGGNETYQANRATNGAGVGLWNAEFFMRDDGQILGNIATGRGGGVDINRNNANVHFTGGRFFMEGNSRIAGNTANIGGGVNLGAEANTHFATFTMSGNSEISGNTAHTNGGGIHLAAGSITQNGGTISENTATNNGGGVNMTRGSLALNSGTISDNTANNNGGAINIVSGTANIINGIISGNIANQNGGGIYVARVASANIFGESYIINNSAPNGEGGGIYTAAFTDYANLTLADYQNITTSATVVFSGNRAFQAFYPPAIAPSYTNIQYASTSLIDSTGYIHPINNYDINFIGNEPIITFSVYYNANGGIGSHVDAGLRGGTQYTILTAEAAGISREGYIFIGWNTQPDGSGISYTPGQVITITGNLTLYAQWEPAREEKDCCLLLLLLIIICRPKKRCCCKGCCKSCCKKQC